MSPRMSTRTHSLKRWNCWMNWMRQRKWNCRFVFFPSSSSQLSNTKSAIWSKLNRQTSHAYTQTWPDMTMNIPNHALMNLKRLLYKISILSFSNHPCVSWYICTFRFSVTKITWNVPSLSNRMLLEYFFFKLSMKKSKYLIDCLIPKVYLQHY